MQSLSLTLSKSTMSIYMSCDLLVCINSRVLAMVLRGYYEFSQAVFLISEARLKNAGTISTVANDISPRPLLTYL